MSVKEVVDKHFTENLKYYESVCRFHYDNRYMWEELRQEAYLVFIQCDPEVIFKSSDQPYLRKVGRNIIGALFQKRKQTKKHHDGNTSPLFESCGTYLLPEIGELQQEPEPTNNHIEEIKRLVFKGIEENNLGVEVFVMSQLESFSAMARRTGLNRNYLSSINEQAKQQIRKQIA